MSASSVASEARFLGHPRGLAYLTFAEAWERFAFYGMQTLLVLYLRQALLRPAHARHVWGLSGLEAAIQGGYGRLSVGAMASVLFGLFAGGVYLTPIVGGFVADRWLGRTRAVRFGAVLLTVGYFLMVFESSFLLALLCILTGVSLFKGNMAIQVGELYPPGSPRHADAFQIYIIGISIALIVSPLICGTLGEVVAWRWGFSAADVGMLVGLLVYIRGRRWLPPKRAPSVGKRTDARTPLTRDERKAVLVLMILLPALTLATLGNQEIFNAYLVWAQTHYSLKVAGHAAPVTWLISLDALLGVGALIASVAFWRWWAASRRAPSEITQLALGATISALAPLVLAAAGAREAATGVKVGLGWAVAFHLVNNIGAANVFAVGLALFSRAAPRPVAGVMIGVFYLHLFAANMAVGWLGGLLERMPSPRFWLLHAALVGSGAAILWISRSLLGATLIFRDPSHGTAA